MVFLFLEREFEKFNLEYTVAPSQSVSDLEASMKENTRLVYIETPSNPLLSITDIQAVADLCYKGLKPKRCCSNLYSWH